MKSKLIDIEGIGKGLMIKLERDGGKDLIEQLKAAVGQAMEAETKSEEERDRERAHEHIIDLIETTVKAAKENNISIADFLARQKDDAIKDDDIECFCPTCMIKSIETITPDDIAKYGKETVVLVCETINAVMKSQLAALDKRYAKKMRSIEDNKERTGKSYEDMSREELIAELTKHKK
jgi:hypothetical protein